MEVTAEIETAATVLTDTEIIIIVIGAEVEVLIGGDRTTVDAERRSTNVVGNMTRIRTEGVTVSGTE